MPSLPEPDPTSTRTNSVSEEQQRRQATQPHRVFLVSRRADFPATLHRRTYPRNGILRRLVLPARIRVRRSRDGRMRRSDPPAHAHFCAPALFARAIKPARASSALSEGGPDIKSSGLGEAGPKLALVFSERKRAPAPREPGGSGLPSALASADPGTRRAAPRCSQNSAQVCRRAGEPTSCWAIARRSALSNGSRALVERESPRPLRQAAGRSAP